LYNFTENFIKFSPQFNETENKIKKKKVNYKNDVFSVQIGTFPILGKILIQFFDIIFYMIKKTFIVRSEETNNLIILSFHRLGDTVFTVPTVREIFKFYSNYNKTILCFPDSGTIYELVFKPENIKTIDKSYFISEKLASFKARKLLKSLKPELIYDITGAITTATLIFNSKARKIYGMNARIYKNIYDHFTEIRKMPHFIDTYLDIIKDVIPIGNNKEIYEFQCTIKPEGILLIHPFAFRKSKAWNLKRFINLAYQLKLDYNIELVAPSGYINDEIIQEITNLGIKLTITETLGNLIDKIKESAVFISNDSGPLYIANLLGKPTFTIYGPTNPAYSKPFGNYHAQIMKKIKCSPSENKWCFTMGGIYCSTHDCMNLLKEDEVMEKLKGFLDEIKIPKKKI
jgi:ADP-heptose:LPS heptosyltransferase